MKIHFFHLMPYRFLPDDFREQYPSVWVDVPSHLYDPAKGHQIYNENLDELEYADRVGFDGICVNEHHQNAYGLMPSPNLMAAALTRRTSNAAIVVLGNSLALYNPPTRVAEEFAMLDCMSGGRFAMSTRGPSQSRNPTHQSGSPREAAWRPGNGSVSETTCSAISATSVISAVSKS
jgi:hypothetical protein